MLIKRAVIMQIKMFFYSHRENELRSFYKDKDVKETVQLVGLVVCLRYTLSVKILEIFEPSKSYFLYQMMSPTISLNFFLVNEPSNFW